VGVVNGYASLADLKEYLGITGTSTADSGLEQAIETASRELDGHCDRQFFTVAGATRYAGPGDVNGRCLNIPDIAAGQITSVKVDTNDDGTFDTTVTEGTGFAVAPVAGTLIAGCTAPVSELIAMTFNWPTYGFRPARVEIVGTFGWAAVPDPIHQACLQLAAQRWKSKDAPLGVVQSAEFGAFRLRDIPSIRGMIADFRRHPLPV